MLKEYNEPNENIRVENNVIRSDYVEGLPIGSFVVQVFKVESYARDCDGSAMVTLAAVDRQGNETGARMENVGLYGDTVLVVDDPQDLWALANFPHGADIPG